jgi:hypothetical protein
MGPNRFTLQSLVRAFVPLARECERVQQQYGAPPSYYLAGACNQKLTLSPPIPWSLMVSPLIRYISQPGIDYTTYVIATLSFKAVSGSRYHMGGGGGAQATA